MATPPAQPLEARAVVTRSRKNYEVVLELAGAAQGTRTLRARTCESVARAAALIIALAIDPQAAAIVSEEPPPAAPPASPPPATDNRASPLPEPAEPPRPAPVRGLGFAGFLAENALLPRLSLGAEIGGGLSWRFVRTDLSLGVVPRGTAELAGHPEVSALFTLAFVAWRACAGLVGESATLLGCASLRGTRLWARGKGASPSFSEAAHVPSFEPGVLLRAPGGRGVGVEAGANLVVLLRRPSFVIVDGATERELFRPGALGAVFKLGRRLSSSNWGNAFATQLSTVGFGNLLKVGSAKARRATPGSCAGGSWRAARCACRRRAG